VNIVNKLTIRHLKQNKRRTLVTIFGVIISVAMITAVATLMVSFLNLLQRQEIADSGEWHVMYQDVNQEQLDAITADNNTEAVVLQKDLGYAVLEGSQNRGKPYLFVSAYNEEGFERFPIHLSAGRLPQSADEIAISEHIATNAKVELHIGDTLTLEIGQRYALAGGEQPLTQWDSFSTNENGEIGEELRDTETRSFTIVGVIERPNMEPTWSPGYTVITYVDNAAAEPVNAAVILKKVRGSLYEHARQLAAEHGIGSVQFNNGLLRYYGITNNDNLQSTLFGLSAVIMSVIIVGSVALIYNAFAISVSERSRHLGMLSSVGATNRQKRNSVFFEGAVIGLISIPIGIAAGLAGIGATFMFINNLLHEALGTTEKLQLTVTPMSIAVACAVSILTIYISTYAPARRASKISAIDAIRQTQDIKLTGRKVKTSRLVRLIFGIEAEIGLKNLKRNKRRYQATVFSLIISIVLFLAVSHFTGNLEKSVALSQDGINYDIRITISHLAEDAETFMSQVIALEDVTEYSAMRDGTAYADDPASESSWYVRLHGMDEHSLRSYAEAIGADAAKLFDPERPAAIVVNKIRYEDEAAEKYVEMKAIEAEVGDRLELHTINWETDQRIELPDVEIAALTDEHPLGLSSANPGEVHVIVSEAVFDVMLQDSPEELWSMMYVKSTDPLATQQALDEIRGNGIYVYNVYQARKQEEQMITMMSVFTYGFIVLISAISVANIFNTISTSIALRKREFAMLKSVGMTPKGFNKMIHYESIFYGLKALLYGLPISVAVMYLIHKSLSYTFTYPFALPWISVLIAIAGVFLIVGSAMLYSSAKVKKENIIEGLKMESV